MQNLKAKMTKSNSDSLTSLTNIGKVTASNLNKIGIQTKKEFLAADPYILFDQMIQKIDPAMCRCALASLVGAKDGIPWAAVHKKAGEEFVKRYPNHKWKNGC